MKSEGTATGYTSEGSRVDVNTQLNRGEVKVQSLRRYSLLLIYCTQPILSKLDNNYAMHNIMSSTFYQFFALADLTYSEYEHNADISAHMCIRGGQNNYSLLSFTVIYCTQTILSMHKPNWISCVHNYSTLVHVEGKINASMYDGILFLYHLFSN